MLEIYERGTEFVELMVRTVLTDKAVIAASEHHLVQVIRDDFIQSCLLVGDTDMKLGMRTPTNQMPTILLETFIHTSSPNMHRGYHNL